jgi:hypothetical protein
VVPWPGLDADGIALSAWQHNQVCERVEPAVLKAFIADYMAPLGRRSVAPEPFAQ